MSENITVAVRIRPLNETEINNRDNCIWSINPQDTLTIVPASVQSEYGKLAGLLGSKFKFRNCFMIIHRTMHGQ